MSLQLNTFTFEGGAAVRTVMQGEEPWFVAADVCAVLEHSNAREAIRGLDEDERTTVSNPDGQAGQGAQSFNLISESGLYTLILRSRKPQAQRFRRWVTHEVLPALRKTGRYEIPKSQNARVADLPRVIQWEGQPWICALDLLDACGYSRNHNLLDRVPTHMRGTALMPTGGGEQILRVVSLSGVACFADRGRNRGQAKGVLAWMQSLGDSAPTARVKPMGVPTGLPALLPPGPGAQPRPLFVPKAEDRAEFAEEALLHHDTIADARDLRFRHEVHMTNLLADLMHLADREGLDYAAIHQRAITHYQSEVRA